MPGGDRRRAGGRGQDLLPLLAVLGGGLALRLVFAYVVFPMSGYAQDLHLFASWATSMADYGVGTIYANGGSVDYPPGYLLILWLLGVLARPVGTLAGQSSGAALVGLLKLPAILADVGTGFLLWWAGRRWFGGRNGLVAAALWLLLPVSWYDSALWGQVDGVLALSLVATLVLLVEGRSEAALVAAVLAVLVKPQGAMAFVVVLPVLVRRHLLAPRPIPPDAKRGGLPVHGPVRLLTSAAVALEVGLAILLPFDITHHAPALLAGIPGVGHIAGLVGLVVDAGGGYAVLTANAFNGWALAGPQSLAASLNGGSWTPDSILVLGPLPAVAVGTVLLVAIGLLVAAGLLRRDGPVPILLAASLVAFAFYAVPTRVHERYLVPFFAIGALLAARCVAAGAAFAATALANTLNLHAVLAGGLKITNPSLAGGALGDAGPGGLPHVDISSIRLPFADLARSQPVVSAVALAQTAVLLGLLTAWLWVVVRPEPAAAPLRGVDDGPSRETARPR